MLFIYVILLLFSAFDCKFELRPLSFLRFSWDAASVIFNDHLRNRQPNPTAAGVEFEVFLEHAELAANLWDKTYLNSFGMSFWLIPTPVSLTANSKYNSFSSSNFETVTVMEPLSVNLTEFEIKLINTCLILLESATIIVLAKSGFQTILNWRFRSTHWKPNKKSISVKSKESLNSDIINLNIFALNFAISSISSIKFNSNQDEIWPIWINLSNLIKKGWHAALASWNFSILVFISLTINIDSWSEFVMALRGVLISCDKLVNIDCWYSVFARSCSSFFI